MRDHLGTRGHHRGVHPALEALHHGAGVCQDFAHLTLALLRAAGIPARYVSGLPPPGKDARPGETVAGESHAWVEAWIGDWWAFDPTNGVAVGERHVVVGRGRDYADVPPLKGVHSTGTAEALDVEVRIPLRPIGLKGVPKGARRTKR